MVRMQHGRRRCERQEQVRLALPPSTSQYSCKPSGHPASEMHSSGMGCPVLVHSSALQASHARSSTETWLCQLLRGACTVEHGALVMVPHLRSVTEHDFSVHNSSQPDRPCMAQSILTRSWPRRKLAKIPLKSPRDRGTQAQRQRQWTQTWRRWAESWRGQSFTSSARSSSWHHPAAPS